MVDLRARLLPRLESHRLAGFDAGDGLVYPNYSGGSICNLPASVCGWLGTPPFGGPGLDAEILAALGASYRHVILLLVDGLGLEQLEALLEEERQQPDGAVWGRFLEDGLLAPLTSIAPSTTAAALTSLWTGVPTAAHGMTGYEMWLKEYSMIVNAITHSAIAYQGDPGGLRRAGFQPETFLPVPTLGPHLAQHGVRVVTFHHQAIYRSSLTTMLAREAKNIPYMADSDLWVSLENVLDSMQNERTYFYIYWGVLDELAHRFGPQDERARQEMDSFTRQFARFLDRLRRRGRGDTLLLVTADHGHLSTPRDAGYELRHLPDLLACLTMQPSGENRLPYLFVRPGREDELRQRVEETWPGQFPLFPSRQVLEAGLFGPGPVYRKVLDRIGDWIAVPRGSAYWWWADRENSLLGRHGGLSRTEMLVPLLALPL